MEVKLFLEDRTVTAGRALPVEAICQGREYIPESRKFFSWAPGQSSDDIEGKDILVTGISYGVGYKQYDLSAGYAIKARLTPRNVIIPYLRKAVGREPQAIKVDGTPMCEFWPVIVRVWEETKLEEPVKKENSFTDNLSYFAEYDNFDEDFDLENMREEDFSIEMDEE